MERDYIGNLRTIVGVNGNKISHQNLLMLKEKYHLTNGELIEMKEYCSLHGIIIYDEEEIADITDRSKAAKRKAKKTVSAEERIRMDKAMLISRHIMHFAAVRARKRVQGLGWLCGTYTSSIRRSTEKYVVDKYSESEMDYIIEHLPEDNDEDTCFHMTDADNPEKIMKFNDELNEIIPKLHINRFYLDDFE